MPTNFKPTPDQVRADLKDGLDKEAVRKKYGLSVQETEMLFKEVLDAAFKLDAPEGPEPVAPPGERYSARKDPKALMFGKWGAAGGAVGMIVNEILNASGGMSRSVVEVLVTTAFFMSFLGVGVAAALIYSQDKYLRRSPSVGRIALAGLKAGLIAGVPSGVVAQGLYSAIGASEPVRIVCWAIAGALLAFLMAKRIPNLDRVKAAGAGAIGGGIGGVAFIILAYSAGDDLARIVGGAVIGFSIGFMLSLAESMARSVFLEIRWPDGKLSNVSLGARAVTIGSSKECDIVLPDLPPVGARIRLEKDEVMFEDMTGGRVDVLTEDVGRRLGDISLTLRRARGLAVFATKRT